MNYRLGHAFFAGYREAWSVLPLAVLMEASLGFIASGGANSPPGLGYLIREGHTWFPDAPWLVFIPGAALIGLVFFGRLCEATVASRFDRHFSVLDDAV